MRINETDKLDFRNVWVVADLLAGKIQSVTHELIGSARNFGGICAAPKFGSLSWVMPCPLKHPHYSHTARIVSLQLMILS